MPALTLIHGTGRGPHRHRPAAAIARGSSASHLRLLPHPEPAIDDATAEERVRQHLRKLGVFL